jgi:hypothetical protein
MIIRNGPILDRYSGNGRLGLTSQGAPETGDIPNAMKKPTSIPVSHESLEYAPTAGTKVLTWLQERRIEGRNFVLLSRIFIILSTAKVKKVSIPMRLDTFRG